MSARIPLFPLHTVLYPGGAVPLRIFEARYVDLVSACLRGETGFGVAPILHGRETGAPPKTYDVGTLARISGWDQGADGLLHIAAAGTRRFRIRSATARPDGLLEAEVDWFDDEEDPELTDEHARLRGLLDALRQRIAPDQPLLPPLRSRGLCYRLAEILPLDVPQRVALLSEPAAGVQLAFIESAISAIFS